MKYWLPFIFLFSYSAFSEVRRAPAVVGGTCDLDIPTTQVKADSKVAFTDEASHLVQVLPDAEGECEKLPQKKYPLEKYEDLARTEMDVLFRKYPDVYAKKCHEFFKGKAKGADYKCLAPVVTSVSFNRFVCEKRLATAFAVIKYKQVGYVEEERPIDVVLKEQCLRVKECLEVASDKEVPELKKLSVVACKNDLRAPASGRAPALVKDESFDGKRLPKDKDEASKTEPTVDQNIGK